MLFLIRSNRKIVEMHASLLNVESEHLSSSFEVHVVQH